MLHRQPGSPQKQQAYHSIFFPHWQLTATHIYVCFLGPNSVNSWDELQLQDILRKREWSYYFHAPVKWHVIDLNAEVFFCWIYFFLDKTVLDYCTLTDEHIANKCHDVSKASKQTKQTKSTSGSSDNGCCCRLITATTGGGPPHFPSILQSGQVRPSLMGRQAERFSGLEAQVGAPAAACCRRGCKSCRRPAGVNCGQAEPISSSLPRVPEARQLLHSYQPLNSQCFMPRLRVFNWCKGDDGAVEWRLIDLVMTMSVWSRLERDSRRESLSGAESRRRGEEEAFIRAAGRTNVLRVVLLQRRVAVWGSRQRLTAACNFDIWRSKTAEPPLGSDILSMQSLDFPWSTLTSLQK